MPIIMLHSAEFADHRILYVNTHWVKWFYEHEPGTTHIVLGDGYQQDGFPVECVPVQESPESVLDLFNAVED